MSMPTYSPDQPEPEQSEDRRDFLFIASGAMGAAATAGVVWPLIDSMNPSADVLANSQIEIDIDPIEKGQRVTVKWQGKPVFIDHRTPERIALAKANETA